MKFFIFTILLTTNVFADPSHEKIFNHPKSACTVKNTAGEYPVTKILKGKKELLSLNCDCGGSTPLYSPDGNYIAFGNSEMDGFDGKFAIAVYNCKSQKLTNYLAAGCSKKGGAGVCISNYAVPTSWSQDSRELEYTYYFDGVKKEKLKLKLTP